MRFFVEEEEMERELGKNTPKLGFLDGNKDGLFLNNNF
jgi:hypothetical protein